VPIKRRRPKAREHAITPEALDAFARKDWLGLHRALGLRPWETSPLEAVGAAPDAPSMIASSWEKAATLRQELLKAGPL
jgi:hypothetical protein